MHNEDYDAVAPLQEVAQRHEVTIVVLDHLRKQDADDPIDMLSGSTGLAASADGIMILKRARGEADAALHVVHREGEEKELALSFNGETTSWEIAGDAQVLSLSREARAVIELLPINGTPVHYKWIAQQLGEKEGTIRTRMSRMERRGEVKGHDKGMYSRPPELCGNTCNSGNSDARASSDMAAYADYDVAV